MLRGIGNSQPGSAVVLVGEFAPELCFLLGVQPGNENVAASPVHHALDDALDLFCRLALAEDHLRCSLAETPVVVYPGITHVLKGGQPLQPLGGCLRQYISGPDSVQQSQ